MSEIIKSRRVIFQKGRQKEFLDLVQQKLQLTQTTLAKLARISLRNFTDWRREKFSLPLSTVKLFINKSGIAFPKNIQIRNPYWYTSKGGSAGAQSVLKKYGRLGGEVHIWRQKWLSWWKQKGRFENFSPINTPKPFKKPRPCIELAEFIGIVLGDGGISRNQITITLHSVDEKLYAQYIRRLISKLFGVEVEIHKHKKVRAISISISRIGLIQWFEKIHNLKTGNKVRNQIDVPAWIKDNIFLSKACARGLIDTDGSVFLHKYIAAGKQYSYKKLAFTNFSKPLVYFVYETLVRLGLHPRFAWRNGEEREVRLDSKSDMKKYFELIGTHNQKFLKRWRK